MIYRPQSDILYQIQRNGKPIAAKHAKIRKFSSHKRKKQKSAAGDKK
jgi:hypothetical protein